MPPDVSSCAAKAGFTKPKIRKRSSKRQDTNATREMFIVFFTVKIETPRDANTHDGHVKSRGISPPRGLRCLFGQRRLQRAVHGSLPRTRYASRPSACQNGHSPRAPCFPYSARGPVLRGLAACVPYREDSTTDRWLFGRQVTWLRQSRDILQLFQRYVITVRSLACRSK